MGRGEGSSVTRRRRYRDLLTQLTAGSGGWAGRGQGVVLLQMADDGVADVDARDPVTAPEIGRPNVEDRTKRHLTIQDRLSRCREVGARRAS